MKKLYGTLLSSGNSDEFELIRNELHKKNVIWGEFNVNGLVIFYFSEKQLKKLPKDNCPDCKHKEYLPVTEDSGHRIYRIEKLLQEYQKNTNKYD